MILRAVSHLAGSHRISEYPAQGYPPKKEVALLREMDEAITAGPLIATAGYFKGWCGSQQG